MSDKSRKLCPTCWTPMERPHKHVLVHVPYEDIIPHMTESNDTFDIAQWLAEAQGIESTIPCDFWSTHEWIAVHQIQEEKDEQ